MSHTPTTTAPPGNAPAASAPSTQQQDKDKKPSLTGVRIKQRKRQAQAASKFEPEAFRDALLVHLALIPSPPTTESLVAKLVQAGSTLEFLRYNEQLFEILLFGGLLQPGGSYLDDKRSPVFLLKSEDSWDGVKGMVDTLKRVIQRYKYLQKPLEEDFLPNILGYLGKWSPEEREKLAEATALFIIELQCSPRCLASLTKEHVIKDGVALGFITSFFKFYLARQNIEHLSATLKKSGLRDLLLVFPIQTRDRKHLEEHLKKENLTPVLDWYNRLALLEVKDDTIVNVTRMVNDEETNEQMIEFLKTQQNEKPVPEADLCDWVFTGLMRSLDAGTRPDQIDGAVVQLVTARAAVLETFCNGAKAEVGLINSAQVYCYADTRLMKSFPQLLKVLYNSDCVSDQAIIYWHAKGAKPQGKQHFLKATEGLVKFLAEQDSDDDE